MILSKVETNDFIDVVYESSNVLASRYDTNKEKLTVTFKNGGQYSYLSVPKVTYLIFENADSQGKILNSTIKQFEVVKEETVDIEQYLSKIQDVKNTEQKNLELGIINRMKSIVARYEEFSEFDTPGIDIVSILYGKYKVGQPSTPTNSTKPIIDPLTGQMDLKYDQNNAPKDFFI